LEVVIIVIEEEELGGKSVGSAPPPEPSPPNDGWLIDSIENLGSGDGDFGMDWTVTTESDSRATEEYEIQGWSASETLTVGTSAMKWRQSRRRFLAGVLNLSVIASPNGQLNML